MPPHIRHSTSDTAAKSGKTISPLPFTPPRSNTPRSNKARTKPPKYAIIATHIPRAMCSKRKNQPTRE
ncbi:hypothetical protein E0W28_04520 [Neisseria meningitidis]|nr:hypothetical protein [Neisseria meningitidis]MBG8748551.1 hypothetical protein [Neisseria meningitidis]MBJ7779153.1 hypothetical protein [Neisseria meningitidis]MBJ7812597.1 hypothetical protein [Neisseria meningitidis]